MTVRQTIRQAIRSGLAVAVICAAAVAAPSTAAPPTAALPTAAERGSQPVPTKNTVTAAQLGADSVVAVVTHGPFDDVEADGLARSLEVITPDGVRHPVYTVEVRASRQGWYRGDFAIADWRPELHTALLRVSLGADGDTLVSYDVTTGEAREVPAPRRANAVALAPDGSGVLLTTYDSGRRPARVGTLTWDGVKTWLPARGEGAAITSIDGRTLVTSRGDRWWLTDLAARTSTVIDTPGTCAPRRWSDADSVVATCWRGRGSQLREVDLDGSSAALGMRHTPRTRRQGSPVFDDNDFRSVQGRAWYESYGGCGGGFLTRTTRDGVKVVRVPGSRGSLELVGTRGRMLVIAHTPDHCGPGGTRGVLSLFDPRGKEEVVLTRLGRVESWRDVLAATEVRSWIS
jgi:hypothetical protein